MSAKTAPEHNRTVGSAVTLIAVISLQIFMIFTIWMNLFACNLYTWPVSAHVFSCSSNLTEKLVLIAIHRIPSFPDAFTDRLCQHFSTQSVAT